MIEDSFEVRSEVPDQFPESMALVWETGGRIPLSYHISTIRRCVSGPGSDCTW